MLVLTKDDVCLGIGVLKDDVELDCAWPENWVMAGCLKRDVSDTRFDDVCCKGDRGA